MFAQILLLPTLVAASSFMTSLESDISSMESEIATRVFSNPVETPSLLVDDGSTSHAPGIVLTITGVEGDAFTTTFGPVNPPQETTGNYGYNYSESGTHSNIVVITGTRTTTHASGTTEAHLTSETPLTSKSPETTVSRVPESSSNPAASPTALMGHAFAGVIALIGLFIFV